jgi:NitT/TauT family transport system substrate-binding protein
MDIKHTLIPLLAAGVLSTFLFAGCGKESAAPRDKVRVGYLAEPAHGLHFIAKDLGYFDEEGLDVELFQFNTTAEGCSAVQAKKLDVGTFGTAAPLLFIARGVDFTIFGGMMIGGQAIIVKPENLSQFKDLSNFKGKKVGLGKLSTGDVIFRGALKRPGSTRTRTWRSSSSADRAPSWKPSTRAPWTPASCSARISPSRKRISGSKSRTTSPTSSRTTPAAA